MPSKGACNSPLLLVRKRADASGKVKGRVVIRFRKPTEWTVRDVHLLSDIANIIDPLGRAMYLSTVDLPSGDHHIQLAEKGLAKTASNTPASHF